MRAASITDLLALSLSRQAADVGLAENTGRQLLLRYRSLRGLSEAAITDISATAGFEDFEAIRWQATLELGRRMGSAGKGPVTSIEGPEDVMDLLDYLRFEKQEHVVAVLLDSKNQVLRSAGIHVGTVNASMFGVREIFREAIRDGAVAVVVAHNHPSGDPEPSPEDIAVTRDLVQAGKLLAVEVLDHVIIGERRFVSLKQRGHLG